MRYVVERKNADIFLLANAIRFVSFMPIKKIGKPMAAATNPFGKESIFIEAMLTSHHDCVQRIGLASRIRGTTKNVMTTTKQSTLHGKLISE